MLEGPAKVDCWLEVLLALADSCNGSTMVLCVAASPQQNYISPARLKKAVMQDWELLLARAVRILLRGRAKMWLVNAALRPLVYWSYSIL